MHLIKYCCWGETILTNASLLHLILVTLKSQTLSLASPSSYLCVDCVKLIVLHTHFSRYWQSRFQVKNIQAPSTDTNMSIPSNILPKDNVVKSKVRQQYGNRDHSEDDLTTLAIFWFYKLFLFDVYSHIIFWFHSALATLWSQTSRSLPCVPSCLP